MELIRIVFKKFFFKTPMVERVEYTEMINTPTILPTGKHKDMYLILVGIWLSSEHFLMILILIEIQNKKIIKLKALNNV